MRGMCLSMDWMCVAGAFLPTECKLVWILLLAHPVYVKSILRHTQTNKQSYAH